MKYKKQVESQHYNFTDYVGDERWISYFYQLDSVFYLFKKASKKLVTILEIGPGDKTVTTLLSKYGFNVKTMDIDKDLKPDIVAALPNIPINKVDCIICCEVLEHVQYKDAEKTLKNMARKANYAVISIPHKSLYLSLSIRLPLLKPFKFLVSLPIPFLKHRFEGQHYWELGTVGYSVTRFKETIRESGFTCLKDYRVTNFPYHHFFILRSNRL